MNPAESTGRELVTTRVFDAPRRLAFEAWSKPEHLTRWWGPRRFSLPVCQVDFRPGGAYRFVMRGPDGADYPMEGVYREVVPPDRIVFSVTIVDESPDEEILTVVTFEDEGEKTRITVRQTFPREVRLGAREGWAQTLDRLGEFLAGA